MLGQNQDPTRMERTVDLTDNKFVERIVSAPMSAVQREDYADWLTKQSDDRADYLRAEMDCVTTNTEKAKRRLRRLTQRLDPFWVACVSRPPFGVCAELGPCLKPTFLSTSADDLHEFEVNVGIQLPADYLAFQAIFGGGRPIPADFRIPCLTYSEGCSEEVRCFRSIKDDPASDFEEGDEFWNSAEGSIAIGLNGEMSQFESEIISMRLQGAKAGHVFVRKVDSRGKFNTYCIAPSFAAFLGMLTDHGPGYLRAVRGGDVKPLRRWLAAGGDPNSLYRCVTLMDHAILRHRPEAVRELLAHGAKGKDRLSLAESCGDQEVVALLRSARR